MGVLRENVPEYGKAPTHMSVHFRFDYSTEDTAQFKGWATIDKGYTERFLPRFTLALSEKMLFHICDAAALIAEPLVIRAAILAASYHVKATRWMPVVSNAGNL